MRKRGKMIIWPQYLDSKRPRRLGRKVPLEDAIPLPSANEMVKSALSLGYEAEIDPNARYPKTWYDPPGLLLVQSHGQKKTHIMLKIAPKIAEMRIKQKEADLSGSKGKKKKKKKYKKEK
jgi:signal recognition particle subunit SRP19